MGKKSKLRHARRDRLALNWAKQREIVAALKATLREESPESAFDLLQAMLNQSSAAQDNEKSPAMEALQKTKLEALRAYAALFKGQWKVVQARDRRMERLKGPGSWSAKEPDARLVRAEEWLDGFHDGLLLFDLLVFRKTRGGITDRAIAALFGREAGASIGTSKHIAKPGRWANEIPKWRGLATSILTDHPDLSDRAVYRHIAQTQKRPPDFGHNVIRWNLPLTPIRQSLSASRAHT